MSVVRRYPAALILIGLALFFNLMHYLAEVHLEPAPGTPGYWYNTTVENLQSEMWQVVAAAFIFEHWRWTNSPEANENAPNTRWALLIPAVVVLIFVFMYMSLGPKGFWT